MSDKATLIATALLAAFFFIAGLLELLDNFIVMMILFLGFIGIIVHIIIVNSKTVDKKNLPQ
jgi:TM2 domain-containing membrane protein YozV